jgi:hypothetical protein
MAANPNPIAPRKKRQTVQEGFGMIQMQAVRRAALARTDPSARDNRVAAEAARQEREHTDEETPKNFLVDVTT